MMTRYWKMVILFLLSGLLGAPMTVAQVRKAAAETTPALKFTRQMTVESLAGLPEQAKVELPSGRRVSVKLIRSLDAASKKLAAPRIDRTPLAFKVKPAAIGTPVKNNAELANALKTLRDTDTVQLPSGRRATVAQIKLVRAMVEKN